MRETLGCSRLVAFMTALLLAASPAEAQPAAKVYRVGYLALNAPPNPFYEAFVAGLRELGYAEGQNVVIESRWAEGHSERLRALATELVRLRTDVIVTAAQAATVAAKQATATVPIVMVNIVDPVGTGLISSFARPGGNITGLSYEADEGQYRKRLQLIREAMPRCPAWLLSSTLTYHSGPSGRESTTKQPGDSGLPLTM
jgi:putative ABC transport system substrate-binding protein